MRNIIIIRQVFQYFQNNSLMFIFTKDSIFNLLNKSIKHKLYYISIKKHLVWNVENVFYYTFI